MRRRIFLVLIVMALLSIGISVPSFAAFNLVPNPTPGFDQDSYKMFKGSLAAGDFDGDGDLDFIGCGRWTPIFTKLFINNHYNTLPPPDENRRFAVRDPYPDSFVGVYHSGLALGDYDNDGDLDIAIAGYSNSGRVIKLYRNDGKGNNTHKFIEDTIRQNNLTAIGDSSRGSALDWGDYNNDGLIDLLIAGYDGSTRITKIYKNTGISFIDSGIALTGIDGDNGAQGFAKFCDYDNDGDLDLAIAGTNGSTMIAKIYRNDDNNFTDIGATLLEGVDMGSLSWGDYNRDGYPDLITQGRYQTVPDNRRTKLYKNSGSPSFTFSDTGFDFPIQEDLQQGQIIWGDINNDGKLDFINTGFYYSGASSNSTRIVTNNSTLALASFSEYQDLSISNTCSCFASQILGDYNNDGKLDLIIEGSIGVGNQLLYHYDNANNNANTSPNPPSSLNMSWSNNNATFSWSAGSDTETPTASLTYNLRVGTSLHGCEIFSVEYSKTPSDEQGPGRGFGNVWHNTNWTIKGLDPDKVYYFEVQTVDNGFSRSPWRQYAIPSMVILKPASENAFAENFYQIAWYDEDSRDADEKLVDPAKISLYYDNDKIGYDGTLIAADISIDDSNNSYNWNVFSLENGIYYIYAELSFSGKSVFCYASGSVKVQHSDIRIVNNVINPVNNDKFSFEFKLSKSMNITAKIFNLQGEPVREKTLAGFFNAGDNKIEWDGKNDEGQIVGMGIYVLIIESEEINNKIKIAVVR